MLYSQETTYAIRIIDALKDGNLHPASEIVKTQEIPQAWGYKIAKKLEEAGFITIKRGRNGGYTLAKDLEDFSFKDVILAIEPDMNIRPCLNAPCPLKRDKGTCSLYHEIMHLQSKIIGLLDDSSMKDVLCRKGI